LEEELTELEAIAEKVYGERTEFYDNLRAGNRKALEDLGSILDQLTEMADRYSTLSRSGAVTQLESLRMLQDMMQTSLQLTGQQQEDLRIEIEKSDYDYGFRRQYWEHQHRRMDAEYNLLARMAQYLNDSTIRSPVRGTVVNVQKSVGDRVNAGEVIFLLQPEGDANDLLVVTAFIPATDSKGVRPGQVAHVAPTNLKPQRSGYMVGEVIAVGSYPATFAQLITVFKNHDLTQTLKGDQVAVMVEIALHPDDRNPTGYRWTGKAPANAYISAGSICSVSFITEERQPLSYVMPWIREKLLGEGMETAAPVRPVR
jgi:HlyD family secretion protein